jgi:hypothetical protein
MVKGMHIVMEGEIAEMMGEQTAPSFHQQGQHPFCSAESKILETIIQYERK